MSNKALLVGVNKYKLEGADLNGCINDVLNVRDILLKYFGFTVKDIRVLADDRATKKRIMDRLYWLIKDAKPGDRLLFHFSGHGSQVRDRDGDELKDQLDEILCPHDMDWDGIFINDDDLQSIFSGIKEDINLEILLDCCHSGTGTREAMGIESLALINSFKPKFLAPPIDIQARIEDDLAEKQLFRETTSTLHHVLFSGCKSNQTSADAYINGTYNGAFTYYFCKLLRDTVGKINRAELLKQLRASLKYHGFSQIPQLECQKAERNKTLLA
ncbi:MAG: caspase family protein [Desulfobacterales bacterium]|nr:caspase family protein [Desulfobacterales bacterium]